MNSHSKKKYIRLDDTSLVAALCCKGFTAQQIVLGPHYLYVHYLFVDSKALRNAINRYHVGKMRIEPNEYTEQIARIEHDEQYLFMELKKNS